MQRNPIFSFKIILAIGDVLAITISFALAFFLRTSVDSRPYYFDASIVDFIIPILCLAPVWIIIFMISGLYSSSVYLTRPKEYSRLFVASAFGAMTLIAYQYFADQLIFPVRIMPVIALAMCFVLLILFREIIKAIRRFYLRGGKGLLNVLVVGNDKNTTVLINSLHNAPMSGYKIVGIVANKKFIPEHSMTKRFSSIRAACEKTSPDVIIQTEDDRSSQVFSEAIDRHLLYSIIPNQEVLLSNLSSMNMIGSQPVISVRITPLIGGARLEKRLFDIIVGGLIAIVALPFILIIAIFQKISSPRGKIFYKEKRLSRFGKKFYVYKFRTHKTKYCNLTPEEAFASMGKPELAKEYRANGDQIDDDPRVTAVGRFLRATSLDELPQLFNVVRGDISLVGPRALQPGELEKYPNKNLILSAKSGLTGLAQVSGRRSISFEERRALDIYYIQNWSLGLDIQIVFRTILTVLLARGAK